MTILSLSAGSSWLPLVLRTGVVGIFGGSGLVLTQMYSRRGALIFPVYAAILAALSFVAVRFESVAYGGRFAAILFGMLIATALTFIATLVLGRRERAMLRAAGVRMRPGRVPVWGLPLIFAAIVCASAGAAYVVS
jgi:hypothetical protein